MLVPNLPAQTESSGRPPIEIYSDGGTRFEAGLAVSEDNVVIYASGSRMYADYAQYNPETHDILLRGHVKIYQEAIIFSGESAFYNLDTKTMRSSDFLADTNPFHYQGDTLLSMEKGGYSIKNGYFTTHDSSKPDYRLRARSVRIYPDNRIIFSNVTLFIGRTPVFWWPYLYQSLDEMNAFLISPGYSSKLGAYVLTSFAFPLTENTLGRLHLDYMSDRGPGAGLDFEYKTGKDTATTTQGYSNIRSYILSDSATETNKTSLGRPTIETERYRLSWQSKLYFSNDWTSTIDINKLSDSKFLEDFYPAENRLDPQPDTVVALTKTGENWTFTALGRKQINDFQQTTERLPEFDFDVVRHPLFGSRFFYESESSVSFLNEAFPDTVLTQDFSTFRADTFHQITYPNTYFGWLSVVPRLGSRLTYYDSSITGGSKLRSVFNLGVESSFKISRTYNDIEQRWAGLDGIKHVIQPYMNLSYVMNPSVSPDELLPIDTYIPSTQLAPFDFPQSVALDSIDEASVLRLGVRNRLLTKRNDQSFAWFELDTYFDVNFQNPYDDSGFSNLFNRLRFNPVPWAALTIFSQLPVFNNGFTEVNTNVSFMPNSDLTVNIGHRYLDQNPFFADSSLISLSTYYQIDPNWGIGLREQYELNDSVLESQRYTIYRDLSSWVASLSAVVRDNRGKDDIGLFLTFTLKELPTLNFNFNFDPAADGQD